MGTSHDRPRPDAVGLDAVDAVAFLRTVGAWVRLWDTAAMEISGAIAERLSAQRAAALWLFGSRARGDHRPGSDADVALLLQRAAPVPGLMEQAALTGALEDALGVAAVDLIVLDTAPLTLRGRVLVEGRLLWSADDVRRVRFTVDTLSRYFDLLPSVREQDRAYIAAVAERGLG